MRVQVDPQRFAELALPPGQAVYFYGLDGFQESGLVFLSVDGEVQAVFFLVIEVSGLDLVASVPFVDGGVGGPVAPLDLHRGVRDVILAPQSVQDTDAPAQVKLGFPVRDRSIHHEDAADAFHLGLELLDAGGKGEEDH